MMNCPKCGSENEDSAKLCHRCYFPLKNLQERSRIASYSAQYTTRQPKQRYNRPLIYVSIIVILGIIGGLIVTKTFLNRASHRVRVYEGTQDVSGSKASKQSVAEISALFKQLDQVLRKDEMIEAVKLQSKEVRELFNGKSLQERMMILASMKLGTAGFTDCQTVVKSITFQDSEKMKATVLASSKCRNPLTDKRMEDQNTFPIVKEEDGWKLDMMAFMKDLDEKLKAKPKEQEDPSLTSVTALFKKWDQAVNSNDPDKFMEIIPNEVKERNPEETRKLCSEIVSQPALLQLREWNTSVERVNIENSERTKATVYVKYSAVDVKTGVSETSKTSVSYPIVKEAGKWKLDAQRWAASQQTKSEISEPKPKAGLVISLSFEEWRRGYQIYSANVYNAGDKPESISSSDFVYVTERDESIEAQIPFEGPLLNYKNLLNLHVLPKTRTSGYLFFKTPKGARHVVFLPTGQKISVESQEVRF